MSTEPTVSEVERLKMLLIEERKRLARDLHDSVNQKLFSLLLIARGLNNQLSDQDDAIRNGIREIEMLAQEALADLSNLIWQRQPIDPEQDFLEMLVAYGEKIGLHVFVECDGEEVDLSASDIEIILRIGQEALNNVKKHAKTDEAAIRFEIHPHQLKLVIADQGCGFEADVPKQTDHSFGITNMKVRASQLGGEVSICSSLGSGTVVTLIAPVREGEQSNEN